MAYLWNASHAHPYFEAEPNMAGFHPWMAIFRFSRLFPNCKGCFCTTDDFATSFLHFPLFSIAVWHLVNSRPVHSLMLFSYLFLCLPCLLPPFTVLCKMVLARPDERET